MTALEPSQMYGGYSADERGEVGYEQSTSPEHAGERFAGDGGWDDAAGPPAAAGTAPCCLWIAQSGGQAGGSETLAVLHSRLSRVGVELAQFDSGRAALSWAERHMARVSCAVLPVTSATDAAALRELTAQCAESSLPVLVAVVPAGPAEGNQPGPWVEPEPEPEPEPQPEPDRNETRGRAPDRAPVLGAPVLRELGELGVAVLRELDVPVMSDLEQLQLAIFEHVASAFSFVDGTLQAKPPQPAAPRKEGEGEGEEWPTKDREFAHQPGWQKPRTPQPERRPSRGGETFVGRWDATSFATRFTVEAMATAAVDIHSTRAAAPTSRKVHRRAEDVAASKLRLMPPTKAQLQKNKPPLRMGGDSDGGASAAFSVLHGPEVLGDGKPWKNRLSIRPAGLEQLKLTVGETVVIRGLPTHSGRAVEGQQAHVESFNAKSNLYSLKTDDGLVLDKVKREYLQRPVAPQATTERVNVVLASRQDQRSKVDEALRKQRAYLLVYSAVEANRLGRGGDPFKEEDAIPLDDCAVQLCTDPNDSDYGVLSLTVSQPDGAPKTLRFSSLMIDDGPAFGQMRMWRERIWNAVLKNREIDAQVDGNVVGSAKFAIVSMPEEVIWDTVLAAIPADVARAFAGSDRVGLCCPRMHQQKLPVRQSMAKKLVPELDVGSVTQQMVDKVRDLINCADATLFWVDKAKQELVGKLALGEGPPERIRIPLTEPCTLCEVVKTGGVVNVTESADPRLDHPREKQLETSQARPTKYLLCAPVLGGEGEPIGVIRLVNKRITTFNDGDLNLLNEQSRFGREVSYIIENAHRVKEAIAKENYLQAGGDWWGKWQSEVQEAHQAGQKLVVYSRRRWQSRREPADLHLQAGANDLWPGHEVHLTAGEPIAQYTVLQQREIAWLREQRFDNLEFRELESLDRIRSELGGGNTYDGEWSASGKQEGTGEMVDAAGTRYTGEWKNGERCGQGVETRKDGRTYTGEWLADKMHGTGVLEDSGDRYEGSFFEGRRCGHGVQTYTNTGARGSGGISSLTAITDAAKAASAAPAAKKGSSLLGRLRAKARDQLPLKYVGSWKEDQHHGRGRLTRVNGQWEECVYSEGAEIEMLDRGTDLSDGKHECTYPNGDEYNGEFFGGKMDGEGTMKYADGRRFKGSWQQGRKHGEGRMTFPSGTVYHGDWRDDEMDGHGAMTYADGKRFEGEYKASKKDGYGEMTFADGAVYKGEYAANQRNGEGTFLFSGSKVNRWELAEYESGTQIKITEYGVDLEDGRAKFLWPTFVADPVHRIIPNGDTYDGDWKGGKMCGVGMMVYATGDSYEGGWENNLRHGTGLSTSAENKGGWSLEQWVLGECVLEIRKGTRVEPRPHMNDLLWINHLLGAGYKITNGPEILGPARAWGEGRADVDELERLCAAIVAAPQATDKDCARHKLLVRSGRDNAKLREDEQVTSLERCTVDVGKQSDERCGVLVVTSLENVELAAFSSLVEDDGMAMTQMRRMRDELLAAVARNRMLDAQPHRYVPGARYAVVALPEEEMHSDHLIYASASDQARLFDGEERASNIVVWSKEGMTKDEWFDSWVRDVKRAYSDGQTLIVFDRRQWESRKEPKTVFIGPEVNQAWPGRSVTLTKGDPIKRFDTMQARQVAWLRKQCTDKVKVHEKTAWNEKRIEFWKVEKTLDELRAIDAAGNRYDGEWSVTGLKHGQGTQVWANGDRYSGGWKRGKPGGSGTMDFAAGNRYEGEWQGGKMHGAGTYWYGDGESFRGHWQDDQAHGRGKYTHADGRWEVSMWVDGVETEVLETGSGGDEEAEEAEEAEESPVARIEAESPVVDVEAAAQQRLDAKLDALRNAEAGEAPDVAEELPSEAPEGDVPHAAVVEEDSFAAEDVSYTAADLLETIGEMDASELRAAVKHHGLPVKAGAGLDALRAALYNHYSHAQAAAEVIDEEIRVASPVAPAAVAAEEDPEKPRPIVMRPEAYSRPRWPAA